MSSAIKIKLFSNSSNHCHMQNEVEKMVRHVAIFNTPLAMINENIWHPPTDVYENKDGFIIVMEIAGMEKGNFDISVCNDALTIAGHRQTSAMDNKTTNNYTQMEIHSGYFEKIIFIPAKVITKNIKASYENGFLKIVLLKTKKEHKNK